MENNCLNCKCKKFSEIPFKKGFCSNCNHQHQIKDIDISVGLKILYN